MKTYNSALCALAALSITAAAFGQAHHKPTPAVQKLTLVIENGFKPATMQVRAGVPVSLTLDTKHRGCASTIIFKSLNITKALSDGKKTVFTFTPTKAGNIAYACGMGMLKGVIIVK